MLRTDDILPFRVGVLAAAVHLAAAFFTATPSHAVEVRQSPNFLFILADDVTYKSLGCYGGGPGTHRGKTTVACRTSAVDEAAGGFGTCDGCSEESMIHKTILA